MKEDHRITMCSHIGGQAASVPEAKVKEVIAGTHPHRLTAQAQPPYGLKSVGRREHRNVIGNSCNADTKLA